MHAEPLPTTRPAATEVVVLFALHGTPDDEFVGSVAYWRSRGHAVLVVLPHVADGEVLELLTSAGADFCTVIPTPPQLFTSIDRARRLHRRTTRATTPSSLTRFRPRAVVDDDPLDAFWRRRPKS